MRSLAIEEVLFKKYYKPLCHFAWQLLHDDESAKDIVQDAFMIYFDRKHKISAKDEVIRQFLYSTVKFSSLNQLRHAKVDAKYMLSLPSFEDWCDEDLELKYIRSEVLAEVYKVVETMPDACKTIFKKGYLEGLSTKEIAEELNISVNTVKTQKRRAMRVLFDKLDPEVLVALFTISKFI
ncbi:RNA polymerase sigma-70 factor [Sphingobacterium sp. lm-10]|uniref:RNA polymerase sigma-70 factor n=1 Tax=Sphingobacterium sp. lm-10 TaxID=2944904 RepID=UPI002021848E|nr:RNA polymerase sigma-70 factor [Sphingobacterium sp. lm-10]MCL7988159.1 RNA polymerase sigma-70 factor [Sphingobacterium sp. lm-10]